MEKCHIHIQSSGFKTSRTKTLWEFWTYARCIKMFLRKGWDELAKDNPSVPYWHHIESSVPHKGSCLRAHRRGMTLYCQSDRRKMGKK
jgi:hypothetical protein